jgi:hypothetical protein
MKTSKLLCVLAILAGLVLSTNVNGQAIIVRDAGFAAFGVLSDSDQMVQTPSGNFNLIVDFQLPEGHPYIPMEGEVVYYHQQDLMGLWWTGEIYINCDGKLKYRLRSKKMSQPI